MASHQVTGPLGADERDAVRAAACWAREAAEAELAAALRAVVDALQVRRAAALARERAAGARAARRRWRSPPG